MIIFKAFAMMARALMYYNFAIIGGVLTSTLLTLVVVPVIYTYLDDLKNWTVRQVHRYKKASSS